MKRSKTVDKKESAAARTMTLPGLAAAAGYIRVSSSSQDHAYQRHAIELAARARGATVDRWFADTASGSTMDRPELGRLRRELARGAIASVWTWRLDRLSRSGAGDTFVLIDEIRRHGAALVSVADGFMFEPGPLGDIMIALCAAFAQIEREKIRENQAAARARLEAAGRSWGRPPLPPHKRDAAAALASQGKSIREIARELQISKTVVGEIVRAQKRGF